MLPGKAMRMMSNRLNTTSSASLWVLMIEEGYQIDINGFGDAVSIFGFIGDLSQRQRTARKALFKRKRAGGRGVFLKRDFQRVFISHGAACR